MSVTSDSSSRGFSGWGDMPLFAPPPPKMIVVDFFGPGATHGDIVSQVADNAAQSVNADEIQHILQPIPSGTTSVATAMDDMSNLLRTIANSNTSARVINISIGGSEAEIISSEAGAMLELPGSLESARAALPGQRAQLARRLGLTVNIYDSHSDTTLETALQRTPTTDYALQSLASNWRLALRALNEQATLTRNYNLPANAPKETILPHVVETAKQLYETPAAPAAAARLGQTISDLRDRGISVVVAAGNRGDTVAELANLGVPFDASHVADIINVQGPAISVGASTTAIGSPVAASFSSPSGEVDIAADGTEIPVSGHGLQSGTSVSAPQVAGLLADLYAINPALTAPEAGQILQLTAMPAPGQQLQLGAGVIQPDAARSLAFIWPRHNGLYQPGWALDMKAYGGKPDGYFGLDDMRTALYDPNFHWGSEAARASAVQFLDAASSGNTALLSAYGFFHTEDNQWLHETTSFPLIPGL